MSVASAENMKEISNDFSLINLVYVKNLSYIHISVHEYELLFISHPLFHMCVCVDYHIYEIIAHLPLALLANISSQENSHDFKC